MTTLDEFIRQHAPASERQLTHVRPSRGFVGSTVERAAAYERQRAGLKVLAVMAASFVPFIARQCWLAVRDDYISLADIPMAELVRGMYHFFLSTQAFYIFLFAGIAVAATMSIRRWHNLKMLRLRLG